MNHRSNVELFGLPEIDSLSSLSSQTRLSQGLLVRLYRSGSSNYRTFSLVKKSGGTRTISHPGRMLKALQGWILRHILDRLQTAEVCKGFSKGTSIVDNADPHVGAKAVLSVDVENFFPSISEKRVYSVYRRVGYSSTVAHLLTRYCVWNGCLPQGSPCSPKLANLVCLKLDRRLATFAGRRGLVFTRYADDMTFSSASPSRLAKSLPMIRRIVEDEGFTLNAAKTRLRGPARQRMVTGLVIAGETAGIGRKELRRLRAVIYAVANAGLVADQSRAKAQGSLDFVAGVDLLRYQQLKAYVRRLQNKHPGSAIDTLRLR